MCSRLWINSVCLLSFEWPSFFPILGSKEPGNVAELGNSGLLKSPEFWARKVGRFKVEGSWLGEVLREGKSLQPLDLSGRPCSGPLF